MRAPITACYCLLFILPLIYSCGGDKPSLQQPPVIAAAASIPIRVIAVLGPGETLGNPTNYGCRLSDDQIKEYIDELNTYSATNMALLSDGKPLRLAFQNRLTGGQFVKWEIAHLVTLQDQCLDELPFTGTGICGYDPRIYDILDFTANVILTGDTGYDVTAINIYFAGNVVVPGSQPAGHTLDPKGAQSLPAGLERPAIVINDLGFDTASQPGMIIKSRITLEHEICHYLLRRDNTPGYDDKEHTTDTTAQNIMRGLGTLINDVRPKYIPKSLRKEIGLRVQLGNWNTP